MPTRTRFREPDEPVDEVAAGAAEHHGANRSVWLGAMADHSPALEAGLSAVREWEAEHGDLADDEFAWADSVLGVTGRQEAARVETEETS